MFATEPYATLKHRSIKGANMAYIDEGQGNAVVFQHGNPTSSYLWRNVMPHLEGLGRLIACDLVGMGHSEKLVPSGPARYRYTEQREHLFELLDSLDLGDRVTLVLHDWGSALGFDWANQHRDRVQGIAYTESIATPLAWSDFPPEGQQLFGAFRSELGDELILEQNAFVERVLPNSVLRELSEEEMAHYRAPFLQAGEDRRPTLAWPRSLPIEGEPADVVAVVRAYSDWLATSEVPKLFINAEPGAIMNDRVRSVVRTWPNQTEIRVPGVHFVQEDSPDQIGTAVADFVRRLRRDGGSGGT